MNRNARVLLLGAHYYGTLAAVRSFGRAGAYVAVADEDERGVAWSSRFVSERAVHPPVADTAKFLEWLDDWGREHPGTLLYPTNDHLAWLFSQEARRLSKRFAMVGGTPGAAETLLDKWSLRQVCAEVAIATPESSLDDPDGVGYPLLLKPRTQAMLFGGVKGLMVTHRDALRTEVARFRELVRHAPVLLAQHPELARPMFQRYLADAETNIISVSGFVSAEGAIVARAARKVLQRPRKVGIGLCFESEEPDSGLVDALAKLSLHVGYVGAFEAEFIASPSGPQLIDFNPRFYSQLGFDIARGLDLPRLVWHEASGHQSEVRSEMERARNATHSPQAAYCHRGMLEWILLLQGMSGHLSRTEVQFWRAWVRTRRAVVTDAVRDPDDPKPAWIDARNWGVHFARHPRSFVKSYLLNR